MPGWAHPTCQSKILVVNISLSQNQYHPPASHLQHLLCMFLECSASILPTDSPPVSQGLHVEHVVSPSTAVRLARGSLLPSSLPSQVPTQPHPISPRAPSSTNLLPFLQKSSPRSVVMWLVLTRQPPKHHHLGAHAGAAPLARRRTQKGNPNKGQGGDSEGPKEKSCRGVRVLRHPLNLPSCTCCSPAPPRASPHAPSSPFALSWPLPSMSLLFSPMRGPPPTCLLTRYTLQMVVRLPVRYEVVVCSLLHHHPHQLGQTACKHARGVADALLAAHLQASGIDGPPLSTCHCDTTGRHHHHHHHHHP